MHYFPTYLGTQWSHTTLTVFICIYALVLCFIRIAWNIWRCYCSDMFSSPKDGMSNLFITCMPLCLHKAKIVDEFLLQSHRSCGLYMGPVDIGFFFKSIFTHWFVINNWFSLNKQNSMKIYFIHFSDSFFGQIVFRFHLVYLLIALGQLIFLLSISHIYLVSLQWCINGSVTKLFKMQSLNCSECFVGTGGDGGGLGGSEGLSSNRQWRCCIKEPSRSSFFVLFKMRWTCSMLKSWLTVKTYCRTHYQEPSAYSIILVEKGSQATSMVHISCWMAERVIDLSVFLGICPGIVLSSKSERKEVP